MRAFFLMSLLFASLSSFSTTLFPREHTWCMNPTAEDATARCEEGQSFYTDQDGRCGCLTPDEFIDAKTCMAALIHCEEGTTYSSIFEDRQMCGMYQSVYVGCGCFATSDAVHATSMP